MLILLNYYFSDFNFKQYKLSKMTQNDKIFNSPLNSFLCKITHSGVILLSTHLN